MRVAIQRVIDGGHSVFSPSGSPMWLGCSGSLIPNLFAPDDSGEDAAYGTVGHMIGEIWLKTGMKPTQFLGTRQFVQSGEWGYMIDVDESMFAYVKRYVDWCKNLPGDHHVETRVDFSELTPIPSGGTADHAACTWQRMVITDLKMGKGVRVYAKDNTQARLYALGFFYEWDWLYDFQEIVVRIAQPRLDVFDDWTVTRSELLEFAEYVRERAAAAWVQNAPRTPSAKACQWCRVQATCAAKAKVVLELSEGVFMDLDDATVTSVEMSDFRASLMERDAPQVAAVATLSTLELEKLYEWRGTIERFFKKVGEELEKQARDGVPLKKYKVVEGRSFRTFRNKNQAIKTLVGYGLKQEDLVTEELASPAQVEELLKAIGIRNKDLPDLLEPLVFRPPGKATLALLKDSRPALGDKTEGVFGDVT